VRNFYKTKGRQTKRKGKIGIAMGRTRLRQKHYGAANEEDEEAEADSDQT
jgi:hypothetical protein